MAAIRSPLVTTTTAVTRVNDQFLAQNNGAARWWDPKNRGGTSLMPIRTLWAYADLPASDVRPLLYIGAIATRFEFFGYSQGTGRFIFQRYDGALPTRRRAGSDVSV
jgi:hypothetical protein